mmetsp:Transcript_90087/g.188372  ORF Transcript_90087/g.188372 Transcript_90087/m.188372 type:complete len:322 (-) Transcript_90087:862-1827(-)
MLFQNTGSMDCTRGPDALTLTSRIICKSPSNSVRSASLYCRKTPFPPSNSRSQASRSERGASVEDGSGAADFGLGFSIRAGAVAAALGGGAEYGLLWPGGGGALRLGMGPLPAPFASLPPSLPPGFPFPAPLASPPAFWVGGTPLPLPLPAPLGSPPPWGGGVCPLPPAAAPFPAAFPSPFLSPEFGGLGPGLGGAEPALLAAVPVLTPGSCLTPDTLGAGPFGGGPAGGGRSRAGGRTLPVLAALGGPPGLPGGGPFGACGRGRSTSTRIVLSSTSLCVTIHPSAGGNLDSLEFWHQTDSDPIPVPNHQPFWPSASSSNQ